MAQWVKAIGWNVSPDTSGTGPIIQAWGKFIVEVKSNAKAQLASTKEALVVVSDSALSQVQWCTHHWDAQEDPKFKAISYIVSTGLPGIHGSQKRK